MFKRLITVATLAAMAMSGMHAQAANTYNIGVFYYQGWHPLLSVQQDPHRLSRVENSESPWCGPYSWSFYGGTEGDPWCTIKPSLGHNNFPERQPARGYYDDSQTSVLQAQVQQMAAHGIKFVVFNHYWSQPHGQRKLGQSLQAFHNIPAAAMPAGFKYMLMWNLEKPAAGATLAHFDAAVLDLVTEFSKGNYLKTDTGKAVLAINHVENLWDVAQAYGFTSRAAFVSRLKATANGAFPGGVFVVGFTPANSYWAGVATTIGFDALSAYNYPLKYTNYDAGQPVKLPTFAETASWYSQAWTYLQGRALAASPQLNFYPPISTGWDSRPWTRPDSIDTQGNPVYNTPPRRARPLTTTEFENHLRAARSNLDANPGQTSLSAVICCWNEYGEGQILEPTVGFSGTGNAADYYGDTLLKAVKKVFVDEPAQQQ